MEALSLKSEENLLDCVDYETATGLKYLVGSR